MKKILILALAITLIFALASCGGCDSHVDENGDSVCDKCEEYITVKVKFNVKYDNGKAFSEAKLLLERGGKTIEIAIDANGNGSADVPVGLYYVSFDGPYMTDVEGVKIDLQTSEINLTVIDNTPDGSEEKPFFISETENQVTLAPGQEIFYRCHASSAKYIRVNNDYIIINYDGDIYQSENGCVEVLLKAVSGDFAEFSLQNNAKKEITTTLYFEAPLGSAENPIDLSMNSIIQIVSSDCTTYYSWTAYKDGMLTINSDIEGVEVSLTKILDGDIPLKSETDENGVVSMEVLTGDVIKIEVSIKLVNEGKPTHIQLSLTIND